MLCILAFLIFLILFPILGFFPEYRVLFKKAWECVFKKITRKPCDVSFGEELKNKVLSKLVFRFPKIAKFLDKTFAFWAFLFVALNIWSLVYVFNSGLNLWVYDTCTPSTGESCSLSGEACGVAGDQLKFNDALRSKRLGEWAVQPFKKFGDTISRVPNRLKDWKAEEYLSPKPTYYNNFDANKPTAVEFIDPGCKYCKNLFHNIKEAGFENKYNLTYVVYPIPDKYTVTGYKFQGSFVIATYLEAVKSFPLENAKIPADWQLLEIIFTEKDEKGMELQEKFNTIFATKDIPTEIEKLLSKIGYSNDQIGQIRDKAGSQEIKDRLNGNKDIVENKVRTIRIPTIIFNGRRFDRVVDVDKLK